jgi:hypothetical protein
MFSSRSCARLVRLLTAPLLVFIFVSSVEAKRPAASATPKPQPTSRPTPTPETTTIPTSQPTSTVGPAPTPGLSPAPTADPTQNPLPTPTLDPSPAPSPTPGAASTPTLEPTLTVGPTDSPVATPTLTTSPTPSPTPEPSSTPTPAATSTPAVASGCPLPVPALSNAQDPVAYGADSSGAKDSSRAFSSALSAGDLDVPGGTFLINSTVSVPRGRRIKCEPGGILKTTSTSAYTMFMFNNNNGGGVWNCEFEGSNYNVSPPHYVAVGQQFIFHQSTDTSGTAGNLTIANNDFNGINGYTAAVVIYASSANQPPPAGDVIACNTAENCGYNFLQITSGINTIVSYNTMSDCSGWVEADNTGQINTGNVATHNSATFNAGVGYANHGGGNTGSWNHITCGASCSGSACNYSGNTCSYNQCGSGVSAWLLQSAVGGSSNDASYTGNTVSGACTVH